MFIAFLPLPSLISSLLFPRILEYIAIQASYLDYPNNSMGRLFRILECIFLLVLVFIFSISIILVLVLIFISIHTRIHILIFCIIWLYCYFLLYQIQPLLTKLLYVYKIIMMSVLLHFPVKQYSMIRILAVINTNSFPLFFFPICFVFLCLAQFLFSKCSNNVSDFQQ